MDDSNTSSDSSPIQSSDIKTFISSNEFAVIEWETRHYYEYKMQEYIVVLMRKPTLKFSIFYPNTRIFPIVESIGIVGFQNGSEVKLIGLLDISDFTINIPNITIKLIKNTRRNMIRDAVLHIEVYFQNMNGDKSSIRSPPFRLIYDTSYYNIKKNGSPPIGLLPDGLSLSPLHDPQAIINKLKRKRHEIDTVEKSISDVQNSLDYMILERTVIQEQLSRLSDRIRKGEELKKSLLNDKKKIQTKMDKYLLN